MTAPLKEFRNQTAETARAINSLKTLHAQPVVDPLKEFRNQTAQIARAIDSIKTLRIQMVQFDKSVINTTRILDEIAKSTAPLISTHAIGIDIFIKSEHPERIEQEGGIHWPDNVPESLGQKVFIACGSDEETKQTVARSVEKLGLEAIIISEQPSGARTKIEQLEMYTDDVDFAVVLLTPDDVGKPKDKLGESNLRASQDVIFGLGVLIGKHGRDRICLLSKGELELPSYINGINPVLLDANGGWILRLIREMQDAGLSINIGKVI